MTKKEVRGREICTDGSHGSACLVCNSQMRRLRRKVNLGGYGTHEVSFLVCANCRHIEYLDEGRIEPLR